VRRIGTVAVLVAVVLVGTAGSFPSVASAALASSPAKASSSGPRTPTRVHTLAARSSAAPSTVPGQPFIENTIPEGLSALVSWAPNPYSDQVTSYTLKATVAAGNPAAACLTPPVTSALGTDSSALVTGLCARVAYVVTMTATNGAGTTRSSPWWCSHPNPR
jgi:hypothetical protein